MTCSRMGRYQISARVPWRLSHARPDFSKLLTSADQRNCLVKLKNKAEKIVNQLREQDDRFRETCGEFIGARKPSSHRASGHVSITTEAANCEIIIKQEHQASPVVLQYNTSTAEETTARAK
jgi:hypothetical protein